MPVPRSPLAGRAAPPPWAGDRSNRPLYRRPSTRREPLPVPDGTVVTAIPSTFTAYRGGTPLRATGTGALLRVRDTLNGRTGAPFCPIYPVGRELEGWCEGAGWWLVIVYPDGTTNEQRWDTDRRLSRTPAKYHDLDALPDVEDLDPAPEPVALPERAPDVERDPAA